MTSSHVVLPLLTIALLCRFTAASADVVVENRYPVKGEPVGIRVTDAEGNPISGAVVEVTYRPGSSVQRTESIGASGAGALQWTPSEAGIATITATWTGPQENEARSATSVSVKFDGPPMDGILIMILAGLLLVVGSVIRVASLLRTPQTTH